MKHWLATMRWAKAQRWSPANALLSPGCLLKTLK